MKRHFNELFILHPGDVIQAKTQVTVSGMSFGPGVRIGRGVRFGGVDLLLHTEDYFETSQIDEDHIELKGVYA